MGDPNIKTKLASALKSMEADGLRYSGQARCMSWLGERPADPKAGGEELRPAIGFGRRGVPLGLSCQADSERYREARLRGR
jgi:hypothetical protein